MSRLPSRLATLAFLLGVCATHAADPGEGKTLMTERGALLFADDFSKPLAQPWRAAKGEWTVIDGAMQVRELKADMHGAVARRGLPHANFVVQYCFKLDGAKRTTLSINDAKGHCCRVLLDPAGVAVQKDSHDKNKADKAAVLDRRAIPLAAGKWHTVVVEVLGEELVATVDDRMVAFGSHPSIAVPKTNLGLTVAGESASFKDLRVWEARPSATWETTKAALQKDPARAASASR